MIIPALLVILACFSANCEETTTSSPTIDAIADKIASVVNNIIDGLVDSPEKTVKQFVTKIMTGFKSVISDFKLAMQTLVSNDGPDAIGEIADKVKTKVSEHLETKDIPPELKEAAEIALDLFVSAIKDLVS